MGRITTGGTVSTFVDPAIDRPGYLTAGPDGNIWFTSGGDASIRRVTPQGVATNFGVPGTGAYDLAAGTDSNIWFGAGANVGRITPAGAISLFTKAGIGHAFGLAKGPDGNMWFIYTVSGGPSGIGKVTPAGTITTFAGIDDAHDLVAGPDGNVWFVSTSGNFIGRLTPSGTLTTFKHASMGAPSNLRLAPNGTLWVRTSSEIFRSTTAGVITGFVPPAGVQPQYFTVGPDQNLWFAGNGLLGRLTLDGVFTTYAATGLGQYTQLLLGPDNNLWFSSGMALTKVGTGVPGFNGKVTDATTAAPLGGIGVTVMNQWPAWTVAATTTTAANGMYHVNLPAGSYTVRFIDPTGAHARTFYNSNPTYKTATTVSLTNTVVDANQALVAAGTLRGRTSHGPSGNANQPAAGIQVLVFDKATNSVVATTVTGADGYYVMTGLAPAGYLVQFVDPTHTYATRWYRGVVLASNASVATITAGTTTWASVWLGA
jgi:streptogramin lyase